MPDRDRDHRLRRLRQFRVSDEPDLSLRFMKKTFDREIARPHKQLAALVELWTELVPDDLTRHTRLEGLSRGVLRVAVDSSSHLYELDRLLRGGLEQELIRRHTGPAFRRVKLSLSDTQLAPPDA